MSDPVLDLELCQGEAGYLSLEIFHLEDEEFAFYYDDTLVAISDSYASEQGTVYNLFVENPIPEGTIQMIASDGCAFDISVPIQPLPEPVFSFRSPSYEVNSIILAREEITFSNHSDKGYTQSEWIFGDGTAHVYVRSDSTSPVRHSYAISGNYFVTLRNYNSHGCSNESTTALQVGKGYNVLAPTVFTPNNDGINDTFEVLFSGFLRVDF